MFHVREGEAKYREANNMNALNWDKEFRKGEP